MRLRVGLILFFLLSQYNVALMHVVNHAFFKALLFLGAGAVIHSFSDQQDVRRLGGLIKFLPFTYTAMLVGTLSLLATPWLTGFYSKDLIIELAFAQYSFEGTFAFILGSLTAGLTAFYSFRLISLVFLTKPNGPKTSYLHSHEATLAVIIPLFVLALFSIFFGFVFSDLFVGIGTDFFGNSIFIHPNHITMVEAEFSMDRIVKLLPTILSLLGAVLAVYLYHFTPHLFFMESSITRKIYTFLNGKYLFDVIYNHYFIGKGLQLGYFVSKVLDRGVIEFIGPYGLSNTLNNTGNNISKLDTGVITTYSLYITLGLLSLVFLVFSPILLETSIFNEIRLLIIYLATLLLIISPFVNNHSSNIGNFTDKNLKSHLNHNGLLKKVNNNNISNIRGIHTSSILYSNNNPNLFIDGPPIADFQALTNGLEELKNIKDSPALEEFIEDTFSEFQELFPHYMEDDQIKIFFEKKKYMDSVKNYLFTKIKEDGLSPEIKEIIKDMPGETYVEKFISYTLQPGNENLIDEERANAILHGEIWKSNSLGTLVQSAPSKIDQPIIDRTSEGILQIDLNKLKELFGNLPDVAVQTAETVGPYATSIMTGVSSLLLYRGVMNVYDRGYNRVINPMTNPTEKAKAIQDYMKHRHRFAVFGSLFVVMALKGIFEFYKHNNPHTININITQNTITNDKDMSLLFLVTLFKSSKKSVKFFVIAVIAVILYFSFLYWDSLVYFFNLYIIDNMIYFKIILFLILVLNILYDAISIEFLNKFKILDKEPSLPDYLPSFIKKRILYLYDLSRMSPEGFNVVIFIRYFSLLLYVILILLLVILILLPMIYK